MDKKISDMVGLRVLYKLTGQNEVKEGYVTELSPSGKFVNLGGNFDSAWYPVANVNVVEELLLPKAPQPLPLTDTVPHADGNTSKVTELPVLSADDQAELKLAKQQTKIFDAASRDPENLAGALYTRYCFAVGGKAFNGDTLPDWPTFRADPDKKLQSDGWVQTAITAVGYLGGQ